MYLNCSGIRKSCKIIGISTAYAIYFVYNVSIINIFSFRLMNFQ